MSLDKKIKELDRTIKKKYVELKLAEIYLILEPEHTPKQICKSLAKQFKERDICYALLELDYSIQEVSSITEIPERSVWGYEQHRKIRKKGKRRYQKNKLSEEEKKEIYDEFTRRTKEGNVVEIINGKLVKMSYILAEQYKIGIMPIAGVEAKWSKKNPALREIKEQTYKKLEARLRAEKSFEKDAPDRVCTYRLIRKGKKKFVADEGDYGKTKIVNEDGHELDKYERLTYFPLKGKEIEAMEVDAKELIRKKVYRGRQLEYFVELKDGHESLEPRSVRIWNLEKKKIYESHG